MEPRIEAALREAAREAQALDTDIVALAPFADLVSAVTVEGDRVTGASEAVAAMRKRKPKLFVEQDWARIGQDDEAFQRREAAFRDGLRTSRAPFAPTPKGLDYSLLTDAEFEKADAFLRGSSNDDSALRRAAERQGGAS